MDNGEWIKPGHLLGKMNNLSFMRDNYAKCQIDFTDALRIRSRVADDGLRDIVAEEEEFLSREKRYGDGPRWRLVVNMPKEDETAHSMN